MKNQWIEAPPGPGLEHVGVYVSGPMSARQLRDLAREATAAADRLEWGVRQWAEEMVKHYEQALQEARSRLALLEKNR